MTTRSPRSIALLVPTLLLAAVLLIGTAATSAGPALAADGDLTWGVRTASNDNGTDRQNFSYTLDPGGSVTDAVIVSNHDSEPLALDVYAADGFTTTSGQLDLVTKDTESVDVGAWSAVGAAQVQIPAGETVEIPFTVTIPADATPGDYAGGILTSLPQPGQEQGVNVDRRLGIRMHVRVTGELAPGLTVEKMQVDYAGTLNPFGTGDATVTYTVHNTGNVRLAAGQSIRVAGPFGLLPSTVDTVEPVPELLPGESWDVTASVGGIVPAFWLSATSVLSPELAVVAGATPGLEAVEASTGTWTIPWSLLVLLLLTVAAAIAARLLLRRRSRQRRLREDARVQEAVDRALREQVKAPAPVE